MTYEKYSNLEDYKTSIFNHFKNKDIDFMDGIIHSAEEYVLDRKFYRRRPIYKRLHMDKVYFVSTKNRKEDYFKTEDYFFRYDRGITSVTPKIFLEDFLFRKFITSTNILKTAQKLHKVIPPEKIQ